MPLTFHRPTEKLPTAASRLTVERWESLLDWPLMGAALLFLIAYAWPILDPTLPPQLTHCCEITQIALWCIFLADYIVRLYLAPMKWVFVRSNLLDLAVIALPAFRPLRLLRLLALVRIFDRHAGAQMRGKVTAYIIGYTLIVLTISSLAILSAERDTPESSIRSLSDALWWSVVTMTTVGYGDITPLTAEGRCVAVVLMVCGVALVGSVTGTLASWMVEKVSEANSTERSSTEAELAHLRTEIAELKGAILELQASLTSPQTTIHHTYETHSEPHHPQ